MVRLAHVPIRQLHCQNENVIVVMENNTRVSP